MVDLVRQFLLNLHENREIGYQDTVDFCYSIFIFEFLNSRILELKINPYQEESCIQLFAQWQSWNAWSSCQDDQGNQITFGKGEQRRTRGCSATAQDGTRIQFTLDTTSSKWIPADLALWKRVTSNDFVDADCHCKGNLMIISWAMILNIFIRKRNNIGSEINFIKNEGLLQT